MKNERKQFELFLHKSNQYMEKRLVDVDVKRRVYINSHFPRYKAKFEGYENIDEARLALLSKVDSLQDIRKIKMLLQTDSFFILLNDAFRRGSNFITFDKTVTELSDLDILKKWVKYHVNILQVVAFEKMEASPDCYDCAPCSWGCEIAIVPEQKKVNMGEDFKGHLFVSSSSTSSVLNIFVGEFNNEALKHKLYEERGTRMSAIIPFNASEKEVEGWGLKPGYVKLRDEYNYCKFKIPASKKGAQKLQGVWIVRRPEGNGVDLQLFEYDFDVQ